MNVKDYLEKIKASYQVNNIDTIQLTGKELKVLQPYFSEFDELKDKQIQIIESLPSDPQSLVTIVGFENLSTNVKIYSVWLQDDRVHIRCTPESLI